MIALKWLLVLILMLIILVILAGQLGLFKGVAPNDLGVVGNRLKLPADTPNSVSSQADLYPNHLQHDYAQIAPLPLVGDGKSTLGKIKGIIELMPGAQIITDQENYLYVQFTTRVMKFVDDAEFWFDSQLNIVQVRSASRIGKSDLGVNRQRIEWIRKQLEEIS
ncbi:MAG: DUF1499 domain-containing protein [Nitrosomonas sp.]|nr:DUF1499 domain-containing protein [Nitrosomonas sp.]MBK7364119.1 DUF1499 domain-containing protein [Nitrosomonas sp.]